LDNKKLVLTAPKKNGGGSANMNSCASNKHCAYRQLSVPNPPLLLAAKRYMALLDKNLASGLGDIGKF
jgi:hypothetical protein